MSARRSLTRIGLGAFLLCFGSLPSAAQTASQITPPSFAPPVESGLGGGIAIGAQPGLDTPPGAEKLSVALSGVNVEGGFPELGAETATLGAGIVGRTITGADIFATARALEAAYGKAGYVLVRVTLPPQKLNNGSKLRLVVVDGFIERIELKDVPDRIRAHTLAMLKPLVGMRHLLLRDLERRVLLAGDQPGVILKSTLAAGSVTGATVLAIDAKYQPLDVTVGLDNSLASALGRYQASVGVDVNGVLGLGETIYLRSVAWPSLGAAGLLSDDPRNRTLAAGFIVPLAVDGLTFNAEITQANTAPAVTPGGFASTDDFDRVSLRLRYAWIRSRDFNFSTQAIFDAENEQESILGGLPLSLDRERVVRIQNEADYLAPWGGTFSAVVTGSFGLDALGARTAGDATPALPLSRQGANATFDKLDGTLSYSQPLADHLATTFYARAQTSFGSALVRAEQINIAGPGALSGFDAGTLPGDSGALARAELSSPFALPTTALPTFATSAGIVASPYVFGAIGETFYEAPTALEPSHVYAASYGLGLRLGGSAAGSLSNGSLSLELARDVASDGQPVGDRVTLVTSIRF
jgi:hemolysin activation/secretion protein